MEEEHGTSKKFVLSNLKALASALATGLFTLSGIITDDRGFSDVTQGQWIVVALSVLSAFGVTYAVPNRVYGAKTDTK